MFPISGHAQMEVQAKQSQAAKEQFSQTLRSMQIYLIHYIHYPLHGQLNPDFWLQITDFRGHVDTGIPHPESKDLKIADPQNGWFDIKHDQPFLAQCYSSP